VATATRTAMAAGPAMTAAGAVAVVGTIMGRCTIVNNIFRACFQSRRCQLGSRL
jgi:hypothetical protein